MFYGIICCIYYYLVYHPLSTLLTNPRPGSTWTHEQASEMMFDAMVDRNYIDIDPADQSFVKDLIDGRPRTFEYAHLNRMRFP